jgi:hypothetical protein
MWSSRSACSPRASGRIQSPEQRLVVQEHPAWFLVAQDSDDVVEPADHGLTGIALGLELDTPADAATLQKLIELTERFCAIYQTLRSPQPSTPLRTNWPALLSQAAAGGPGLSPQRHELVRSDACLGR